MTRLLNRRQFSRLIVNSALLGAGCVSLPPARAVRVMTYNLHHGAGVDGRLDLERIAHVIRSANPDIVALQEVDQGARRTGHVDQAAEYARLTRMQFHFGKAIDLEGGAYGQAILSRLPMNDFKVHFLPNPSQREQRIAVSARIRAPWGMDFRFIGTHFDHVADDRDRWEQAGKLLELFPLGKEPAVLAGDFNATPESRVMKRIVARWIDVSAANPLPTIPAEAPKERIDYILVSPAQGWQVRSATVIPESVASDHRPVVADLVWVG